MGSFSLESFHCSETMSKIQWMVETSAFQASHSACDCVPLHPISHPKLLSIAKDVSIPVKTEEETNYPEKHGGG
jgi:hypothetical protein